MAEQESKIILEREYIVPLRREFLKVPGYRKAEKAVKALKEFMVRHMKVYDRDLRKIKLDVYLNNEIRFRGMKKPLPKVKVKAIKYDNGIVEVKLVQLPKHIEFELARKTRKQAEAVEKAQAKPATSLEAKTEEKSEEKKEDVKEKKEASKEATEKMEKAEAKELKHTSKISGETPKIQRKALRK
jgi:large subunit ribosomal protein L31e